VSHEIGIYSASDANKFSISYLPSQTSIGRCVRGRVRLENSSPGEPAVSAAAITVALAYGGSTTMFYSDSNCTTALSSGNLSIAASTQNKDFYFKAAATHAAANVTADYSTWVQGYTSVEVGTNNLVAWYFNYHTGPSYSRGQCVNFDVYPNNEIGTRVTLASATAYTVDNNGAAIGDLEIYPDGNCSGTPATSKGGSIYSNSDYGTLMSFKAPSGSATGSRTINVTGAGATPAVFNFSVF
jgi:hypothetical protein